MSFDEFLREAASLLGLQWRPFRRKGIKRKVERRIARIGLPFEQYLFRIRNDPEERHHLSKILTVTISRFFREREVFHTLRHSVIPALLTEEREEIRVWSIGCANGEEPYSLSLLWKEGFEETWPHVRLSILATDINGVLIERAKTGRYTKASLKEIPEEIRQSFFKIDREGYALDEAVKESVEFREHDILLEEPFTGMDMAFCRNLAFTYFSKESQVEILKKIAHSIRNEGYLVIGKEETLPLAYPTSFVSAFPTERIYKAFTPPVFDK
jgi:chemotaxis protein methyltransferase CheR